MCLASVMFGYVVPSLSVVRYIKVDEEVRRRYRKVLYEGFNGSME